MQSLVTEAQTSLLEHTKEDVSATERKTAKLEAQHLRNQIKHVEGEISAVDGCAEEPLPRTKPERRRRER